MVLFGAAKSRSGNGPKSVDYPTNTHRLNLMVLLTFPQLLSIMISGARK